MPIVDRSNAGDDTGFVVEDSFDDMRSNAHHGHIGRHGSAQVVETPILCINKGGVEPFLKPTEAGDRRCAGCGENQSDL